MSVRREPAMFRMRMGIGCLCAATSMLIGTPAWSSGNAGNATSAIPAVDVAEFIVNIASYSAWPSATARKSLTICFAHGGALPVAVASSPDQNWAVKGVPVNWQMITTRSQIGECNVVWLNADVRPAPRDWIASIVDQPVLTISNYADFTADGGIIGAYRVGPDWRFEVNLEALQRSRINIAAVALRLSQKPRPVAGSSTDTGARR